jgi:hypothetical protein
VAAGLTEPSVDVALKELRIRAVEVRTAPTIEATIDPAVVTAAIPNRSTVASIRDAGIHRAVRETGINDLPGVGPSRVDTSAADTESGPLAVGVLCATSGLWSARNGNQRKSGPHYAN